MDILNAAEQDTWRGGRSFTLRNRIYRAVWQITWFVFASWTPPQSNAWRRFLLRSFGAQVASTAGIYPSARIWSPANLVIGDCACIGPRTTIYSMATITLEAYSLVSQGGCLCAGTHDIEDQNFQLMARPITLCRRAWVAAEAFVGPGVTIGRGAVLGARGCAFSNLEPWTVYAGNPARPLKTRAVRFSDCPT
jgi:putative colanic acid biosynthesis acetyltransferase WcaF